MGHFDGMDTTKAVTHIGLCAGYGGIELGLRNVVRGLRTVALCEIEAFAIANLVAKMESGHMDPAPIWPDLKTFPYAEFRDRVDILTGGYPCQPFSAASQRKGQDDPRHLWPWIADGIASMRPRVCFFENVEGHISLGLRDVIEDLGRLGYRATWGIFSAAEVGAPHQRKRVFILAHCVEQGLERYFGDVSDRSESGWFTEEESGSACKIGLHAWPSRPGRRQNGWEPCRVIESSMGRDFDGSTSGLDYAKLCISCNNRTDELRLLGNGVVPQVAALAFKTLMNELWKH